MSINTSFFYVVSNTNKICNFSVIFFNSLTFFLSLYLGYKAKLRFEGFVDNSSKDFWVDLCSEEVHPVGWCATKGNALIPPKSIQNKYRDWKEFLMKRLTGARTLPTNFHLRIAESIKSRFR